jgi:hypothetical protein
VDRVARPALEPPPHEVARVVDPDEDHATGGVGKRDGGRLDRAFADAGLELYVVALSGKRAGEDLARDRERNGFAASGMNEGICQSCLG